MMVIWFLCLRYLFERDGIAKRGEPLYVAPGDTVFLALIEVVGAELFIGHPVLQYVVAADEDFVAHRDQCLLLALSAHKALVFRTEVRALHFRRDPCELGEYALEVVVPMAGLSGFFLARAFMVTGAHPRPRSKMGLGREEIHVYPHFGDEDRGVVFHRRYSLQELVCFLEVELDLFLDLLFHRSKYLLHGG